MSEKNQGAALARTSSDAGNFCSQKIPPWELSQCIRYRAETCWATYAVLEREPIILTSQNRSQAMYARKLLQPQ